MGSSSTKKKKQEEQDKAIEKKFEASKNDATEDIEEINIIIDNSKNGTIEGQKKK